MRVGQLSAIDFVSKVTASLLGFVATIYFARVLGASVLGTYYLVLSVVGWLSLLGTMGIGGGLIKRISEGDDGGAYLVAGAVFISGFFLTLTGLLLAGRETLDSYIGVPAFVFVVVLLAVGLAGSFVDSVLQGQRLVHVYSLLKPVRKAIRVGVQISAVIAGFGLTGLVAGYALGGIVAVLLGLLFVSTDVERPQRDHFESLLEYAKYAWLGKLKSKTFNRADILILGAFAVPSLVGVYSIAWNIAGFLSIFSSSISSALFPQVSNISAQTDVRGTRDIVQNALAYAGLITIPGLAGGAILGKNLLALYGPEFVKGSLVLVLLIAATVIYDYQKVTVSVLGAIDRPDLAFYVNGTLIVSNLVLNLVLIYFYGWVGAAVGTLASAVFSLLLGYYLLNTLIGVKFPVGNIVRQTISAGVMVLAVVIVEWTLSTSGVHTMRAVPTIGLVAFGAGIYGLTLLSISPTFRRTVFENLKPLLDRFDAS